MWREIRSGRITASEAASFFIEEKKLQLNKDQIKEILDTCGIEYGKRDTLPVLTALLPAAILEKHTDYSETTKKARKALYAKKIAERSGSETLDEYAERVRGFPPQSVAMQRGHDLEPDARALYAKVTGYDVEEIGFCEHDNGLCGASPDGFMQYLKKGVEIKCHGPEKHEFFLLNQEEFVKEHEKQVQWSLAVTGYESWDLFGYCPKLPWIHEPIYRNELTEKFVKAIETMSAEYLAEIEQHNAIFAEQRELLKQLNKSES